MQTSRASFESTRIHESSAIAGRLLCLAALLSLSPLIAHSQADFAHDRPVPRATLSTGPYGIISPIAGTGNYGYTGIGGPALEADLASPQGVAVDAAGNIYIANSYGQEILRISAATGDISVFAGSLAQGYSGDNGPATGATFNFPTALAFDPKGNLLIADTSNNVVRKIDLKTGVITTVAGIGSIPGWGYSGDGGPATKAQFRDPQGMALDPSGNILIADTGNGVIRRVDAKTGVITTVAGGGQFFAEGMPATQAYLSQPQGITVDQFGNIFIAIPNESIVRRVDALTGTITTVAGLFFCYQGSSNCQFDYGYSGDGGPATQAKLASPFAVEVDAVGNLYIADWSVGAIRRVDAYTGIITTLAGNSISQGDSGDGGPASSAAIDEVKNLAFDDGGNLLLSDSGASVIRKVTLPTKAAAVPPVFSLLGEAYRSGQTVTLTTTTPSATIYYTTDGSIPTTASAKFASPIKLTKPTTLTAFASAPNLANSLAEAEEYYAIAAPTISPSAGSFNGPITIAMSATEPFATLYRIFYTVDGSSPTGPSAAIYLGPFTLNQTAVIKAAVTDGSGLYSPIATATFTIKPQVAPPAFSPAVGSYPTAQSVTLTDSTPGATIFYSLNGSSAITRYNKPIPVVKTTTIQAFASVPGDIQSPASIGAFAIQPLPIPTTAAATALTATSATFNGTVNRESAEADYWFVYGTSATTLTSLTPTHTLPAGASVAVSAPILDLTAHTKYYFQLATANASGTATGKVLSFTTP